MFFYIGKIIFLIVSCCYLAHQNNYKNGLNHWQQLIKKRQNDFLIEFAITGFILLFFVKNPVYYVLIVSFLGNLYYFRQKIIYDVFRGEYMDNYLKEHDKEYIKFDDEVYPL